MADLACTAHITMWTSPDELDGLVFGRTMDRLYGLILDQSRPPGPIVGPLGTLSVQLVRTFSLMVHFPGWCISG